MSRTNVRPRFWFWAYDMRSMSARALVELLDGRLIRQQNSSYQPREGDILVNWGRRTCPYPVTLNRPEAVHVATSKLQTFAALRAAGVNVPAFTTDRSVAEDWNRRGRILGRDRDRGSQGQGITVYEPNSQIGAHRFYTRYMRQSREIRVHVFRGTVIFEQEKLRKHNATVDPFIRSHRRGWVFGFKHLRDQPSPEGLRDTALTAVLTLGLDFGAVDLVWNSRTRRSTVLEVNTAPGIENTSLAHYARAFQRLL